MLDAVVVLALMIGIAGVVVPLLTAELHDSRITRAVDDTSRIAGAYANAMRDLACAPGEDVKDHPATALLTSGTKPDGLPLGRQLVLSEILGRAPQMQSNAQRWKGPYLGEVGSDPWGRGYVVLVPASGSEGHIWALSGGRDGIVQTSESDDALRGDDIGVCIR